MCISWATYSFPKDKVAWGNSIMNRMLFRVCRGPVQGLCWREMGEAKSQNYKKPRWEIHARDNSFLTVGAGKTNAVRKLTIALSGQSIKNQKKSKEPEKKQGSQRILNPWIRNGIILRREKSTEGKVNPFLTALCPCTQAEASRRNFQSRTPSEKSLVSWLI